MPSIAELLTNRLGPGLFFNEPTRRHTTFLVGGPATFFYLASSEAGFVHAIEVARSLGVPYYIIGGGSNTIFSDKGFDGLVIQYQHSDFKIQEVVGSDVVHVSVSGGTPTATLLHRTQKQDLTGIEFLSGIPGTIGGAVVANAHAYFLGSFYQRPKTISEEIVSLKILTPNNVQREVNPTRYEWLTNGSTLKESGDIVLGVTLRLTKGVSLQAKRYLEEYRIFRADKPYFKYPSAGSVFRNFLASREKIEEISASLKAPALKAILPYFQRRIVPAGWAIDFCLLRGKRRGGAEISPEHGNFIVNVDGASFEDIVWLIDLRKERVYNRFAILLQEEIRIVP